MKLIRNNQTTQSLKKILNDFISENDIAESALAEMLGVDRRALDSFLNEGKDLKFTQAISIMSFLNMDETDFIEAYMNDISHKIDDEKIDEAKELAYLFNQFDVPTLKDLGIIKKKSKLSDYVPQMIDFLGFKNTIFEYNNFAPIKTLYSRSKFKIERTRQEKMNEFWIRCSMESFKSINNPWEYDRSLLQSYIPKISEYTTDTHTGFERVIMTLYRLGVTVLVEPYLSKIGAFGACMFVNNKPCIIITDMMKKYHKLWITLLHELYHLIHDEEMLKEATYHLSQKDDPDLLFNESNADKFALNLLIKEDIRKHIPDIISSPYRVKSLAEKISVDPSIIYGIYLETLPQSIRSRNQEFAIYNKYLLSSEIATKPIIFDPIKQGSLKKAIDEVKQKLNNLKIA